jgi:hypothetical protein
MILSLSAGLDGLHVRRRVERHTECILSSRLSSFRIVTIIISAAWAVLVVILSSSFCRRNTCGMTCAGVRRIAVVVRRRSLWCAATHHIIYIARRRRSRWGVVIACPLWLT